MRVLKMINKDNKAERPRIFVLWDLIMAEDENQKKEVRRNDKTDKKSR